MEVICRAARAEDTADVHELCRNIWDGHDYVPQVWPDWLADPLGLLAVAEYQGHVIGLYKLSQVSQNEWWLQGLRVHPDFQGRGVASRLHDHALEHWQRLGGGTVRLATSAKRVQVHHMCERSGFRKAGEYSSYSALAVQEPCDRFQLMPAQQAQAALNFVLHSELHALCFGLMDSGWEWAAPSQERLVEAAGEGRAWWWQPGDAAERLLLVTGVDDDEDGFFPVLWLLGGRLQGLEGFLGDYRRLAAQLGYPRAVWVAPCQPPILQALSAAGFTCDWDNSLYIFVKSYVK